jgi:hypothetical protein
MTKERDVEIKKSNKKVDKKQEEDPKKLASRIRKSINKDRKNFEALLEQNSPDIDKAEVFKKFTQRSGKASSQLIDLATSGLAFVNAVHYANQTISNSLGAEDTAFDFNEIRVQLRKVIRVKMARIICRELKVPREHEKQVIFNMIEREFQKPIAAQGVLNGSQISSSATQRIKQKEEKATRKTR